MIRLALRQLLIILLAAALPAAVSGAVQLKRTNQEPLAAGEIRPDTARMWGENVLWVDARNRGRFEAGHIGGALLLNEDDWDALVPAFLDQWSPDKTVVVYCDGGGCEASREVAERLRSELQIQNVFVLKGGYPAWQSR